MYALKTVLRKDETDVKASIVGVLMGSLAASAMIWPSGSPMSAAIALIIISVLSIGTAYMSKKALKKESLLTLSQWHLFKMVL